MLGQKNYLKVLLLENRLFYISNCVLKFELYRILFTKFLT